jgi:hypothetical protein
VNNLPQFPSRYRSPPEAVHHKWLVQSPTGTRRGPRGSVTGREDVGIRRRIWIEAMIEIGWIETVAEIAIIGIAVDLAQKRLHFRAE